MRAAPRRSSPVSFDVALLITLAVAERFFCYEPGDSSRRMTSSANAAARAPSTTRWSNVTETLPIWRTTISPSRTTGRGPIRCRPRMPTSGWFTSGVAMPLRLGRQLVQRGAVAAADDRDDEPLVGLDREAEVVALEVDDHVPLEPRIQFRVLA